MNDNFNDQKDILISIKKEISLLHQQVDYLIRNEKPLELLDLDVMMNRTHTLYDLMCSVDLGVAPEEVEDQDEELPVEPEVLRAMFGVEEETEEQDPEPSEEASQEEVPSVAPESSVEPPVEEPEDDEDAYFEEEPEDFPAEEPIEEASHEEVPSVAPESSVEPPVEEPEDDEDAYFEEEPEDFLAESPVEEASHEEVPSVARDDFGFILNFEPIDTPVEEPTEDSPSVFTTGDEIEMTIPHIETPDNDYEIETLGDKLQQEHNPTVADKLQHSAVSSLRSSIGINDKFLFVNELFNGSMEKYNRSIENLDDLKTLNGALIYLNELRVELQWNSSNEAYKKLLELVHRKFEA